MQRTVQLNTGTIEEKKIEIKNYFLETVELENSLFSLLKEDLSFYQQPEPLRHPLIFYFGHTFTFYINKLHVGKYISERVHPFFESLFAIGVDEMSWDDLNKSNYDWPSVQDVRKYREEVKNLVLNYIEQCEFQVPIVWDSSIWPVLMGIEHHRIHLETSSVLIRQLDLKWIQPQNYWAPCNLLGPTPQNQLLDVSSGTITLGKNKSAATYGWDNEYGVHTNTLKKFKASEFLVSNGEFLEFVNDKGYQTERFWTEEGRQWKSYKNQKHPIFWNKSLSDISDKNNNSGDYLLRTIDREIPLPLSWPVEVNYLEAKAFCNWKSEKLKIDLRLPTEDEWYLLYKNEDVPSTSLWKSQTAPGNIHLDHFRSSCPVNHFKFKNFYDVIGNAWQWTETPMYPFDGFEVHPLYDDFSVPTFDTKHNLIKGGSWISTGNEALPESRYAFRRHFFQHAGFRYVQSNNQLEILQNPYETDSLVTQYCEFHYGDQYFGVQNFPQKCIEESQKYFNQLPKQEKALDLGCALGRATLELSFYFKNVIGLDFSARFIDKAKGFIDSGSLRYTRPTEGELHDFCERNLEQLFKNKSSHKFQNIEFYQADACNLSQKYSDFDLIFAGNLIDRLYSPRAFLSQIHKHLVSGGLLILTSPYTWLEEYTPKNEWIGGYKENGENKSTLDGLHSELDSNFTFLGSPIDIPFIIRETQRKHQHTIAQMTIWQRK